MRPASVRRYLSPVLMLTTLVQYPFPTFIENVLLHDDKQLLVTMSYPAQLHAIPLHGDGSNGTATTELGTTLRYQFSEHALMGITAPSPSLNGQVLTEPDAYVIAGDVEVFPNFTVTAGTFSIYAVTLITSDNAHGSSPTQVQHCINVIDGQWLNGITALPYSFTTNNNNKIDAHPILLTSDSTAGAIFSVFISPASGGWAYSTWFSHQSMQPVGNAPLPIGVNGIRYHDGYIYYTNTFAHALYRLKVNLTNLKPHEEPELLVQDPDFPAADDFAIAVDKYQRIELFVTGSNRVVSVTQDVNMRWSWRNIIGAANSTLVAGATSAAFGDNGLYIVTGGSLNANILGFESGGKVVAVGGSTVL